MSSHSWTRSPARARDGAAEIVVIDGEAGIGKTTLLRAWARLRAAAGDTVLAAQCGPLDRSMPLDALLNALSALLRRLGHDVGCRAAGRPMSQCSRRCSVRCAIPQPLPVLADSMLGPAVLYGALARVLGRLAARGPLVVLIDDAHLAGRALPDLLHFIRRAGLASTVVAAVRSGEGYALPAAAFVHLDVLTRNAATELVGAARVDALYARSKGHPLFLTELAQRAVRRRPPRLARRLGVSAVRRAWRAERHAADGVACSGPNSISTCWPRSSGARSSSC